MSTSTTPAPDILNLYRERKQHALNHYASFFSKIARRYDLYRGFYRGNFQAFRNNIHIPFLFSVIQSDVARKVQTSFGGWPVVDFVGTSHEDAAIAKKVATLVSAQMKDADSFTKAVDFYLSADMYGTAVARDGWRTLRRHEQWRELDPSGMHETIKSGPVTRFDGPDWDNVDLLDFWPQPGRKRIKEAMWADVRYYLDLDEIEAQAQLGVYDKPAVEELRKTGGMPPEAESQMSIRYSLHRTQTEYDARKAEKYARPVECVDMIGLVPDEFAPDGFKYRIVTVANDRVVLRNRPFPFWHGELPFHVYSPMSDPHYLHGVGKIEVGEKMQYLANRFANQKADALDLLIDPMWLVNRQAGVDTQNLYTRAGRVIGVDGPVGDDVIRPLTPDMRGLSAAYQEIAQMWGWIQQSTGIVEDTVMGMQPSGGNRQTATAFLGRQENVLTRQMLEARLAEEGFIEPLANRFRMLNKQFLKVPHALRILGADGQINPVTGLPLPQEPQTIDLSDINPDYRARAVGATQMLGKSVRQQNIMLLLQTTATNPVAVQVINWVSFFRYIFRTFDLPNTDDFFVNQIPGVNQVSQQSGMSPEQVIQTAAGAMGDEQGQMAPNQFDAPTLSQFLTPALEAGTTA